ncbi:ThiF family adenylyltransferase [Desulfosarcina sp.]|uniref:HesA/MoeB/ThiF family protein n=1 Tax=Desulfosarcina sp. TaxID=2027861 RepID=UPI0035636EBD
MPFCLSEEEKLRYRRQLSIPEIGVSGQRRLKQATVLIAGLGGLGSISAYYMAAAGIGHLKIIDMDRVAGHNLNRQILHTTADLGKEKTASALAKLKSLNPWCHIEAVAARITDDTVGAMVSGCDLILDGTDTIDTRRVIHHAAWEKNIPFIFGGVNGFDGMVATFIPGRFACLECIFPANTHPVSEAIGIVGPAAGVIASLQCVEAVKLLIGRGAGLSGSLMHFHGLDMRIKKIAIERNPDCRICHRK